MTNEEIIEQMKEIHAAAGTAMQWLKPFLPAGYEFNLLLVPTGRPDGTLWIGESTPVSAMLGLQHVIDQGRQILNGHGERLQ